MGFEWDQPAPKAPSSLYAWPVAILILIAISYTPLGDDPGLLKNVRGLTNAIFSTIGLGGGGSTGAADSGLHVVSFKYSYEYIPNFQTMSFAISGTAKNDTRRNYSYAQISFNLYDASGNQIGSEFTNINNLEPGGVWKFSIPITQHGVRTVTLKGIHGR